MSRSEDIARIVADACNALLAKTNSPIRVCAGDDVPFAAAKAIEAVSAPSALPVGWQLVPVEPTEEMQEAGYGGDTGFDIYWGYAADGRPGGPYDVYGAMLSASPPSTLQKVQIAPQSEPVSGWRDIVTAPPYRVPVLLIAQYPTKTGWTDIYHGWRNAGGSNWERWPHDCQPTHWMPLPSPPSEPGVK